MSTIAGPGFLALQVRDLERAAAFYEEKLGLQRAASSPPGAVVFATEPIALAVREPLPGTDLDRGQPGLGVARGCAPRRPVCLRPARRSRCPDRHRTVR